MEEAVLDQVCIGVRERLRKLIARGARFADENSKTPAEKILTWLKDAEKCLADGGEVLGNEVAAFRDLRQACVFHVDEDSLDYTIVETEEGSFPRIDPGQLSASAYMPDEADVLLDFRFDCLLKANGVLIAADNILKGAGLSKGSLGNETLGERLRATRKYVGHSQREAAVKLGYDHKYISEWETGKSTPGLKAAKNIRDYIKKYSER